MRISMNFVALIELKSSDLVKLMIAAFGCSLHGRFLPVRYRQFHVGQPVWPAGWRTASRPDQSRIYQHEREGWCGLCFRRDGDIRWALKKTLVVFQFTRIALRVSSGHISKAVARKSYIGASLLDWMERIRLRELWRAWLLCWHTETKVRKTFA